MQTYPQQLAAAAKHLTQHDPRMAELIRQHGSCTLTPNTDYYAELAGSIISQQLSVKAADTIWKRFLALFGDALPMPQDLAAKSIDELRTAGLSNAKAVYIKDLAQHILDGRLEINKLPDLDNDQIIRELTAVKGIGEWTAQMFLMFCLGRLDVLATGDLGIRNGLQRVYDLPVVPSPAEVAAIATTNHWHPYETVACWYIWRFLDNKPVSADGASHN